MKISESLLSHFLDHQISPVIVQDCQGAVVFTNCEGRPEVEICKCHGPYVVTDINGTPIPENAWPNWAILKGGINSADASIMIHRSANSPITTHWQSFGVFNDNDKLAKVVNIFSSPHVSELERLHFLDEVSIVLSQSLDFETTLHQVAQLAVKVFGGLCCVATANDTGNLKRLAMVHDNPQMSGLVEELIRLYPSQPAQKMGPYEVARTGRSIFIREITDEQLRQAATSDEHLRLLRLTGLKTYMCVPLRSRNRILGVIYFASSQRHFTQADLHLAEELAKRASLAMDNASLFEQANQAIRIRDDFLSIASHELRTPLTPLKLQLQSLGWQLEENEKQKPSLDKIRKVIVTAEKQVSRLTALIENLLDISRLGSGRLVLNREDMDLAEVLLEIVDRFKPQLAQARCPVKLSITGSALGFYDRLRIEQVMINLLTNAMKYARGHAIEISLATTASEIAMAVRDHGPGIPPEHQAKIFDRFERITSETTIGGLGLGLFITRQIVEAHSGSIKVESKPNKGATFVVKLPREPQNQPTKK